MDWNNMWFLKNNIIGTVSCPVTPDSILKKSIQNTVNDYRLLVLRDETKVKLIPLIPSRVHMIIKVHLSRAI